MTVNGVCRECKQFVNNSPFFGKRLPFHAGKRIMKPLKEKGGTHLYQKEDVRKFLDEKQISYEWFDHKAVFTIDEMLEIGLEKEEDIAKNLFLRDNKGKRHFLVVIREDKQADLKSLGEKIGAGRLSFASEERLMKYLGLTKGSVTPFGILNDTDCAVEVIFDEDFRNMDAIGVHPNDNTASVFLAFSDLVQIIEEHGNSVTFLSL